MAYRIVFRDRYLRHRSQPNHPYLIGQQRHFCSLLRFEL
jgi:hypothetical protein